jgi:hypothetical protein
MAKLILNGSTSGSVTLSSPAVSGTTTLTLPTTTDTLVGKTTTDTLTNKTLTNPTFDSAQLATVSGTAPLYMSRAWVNFNGTGTVAIRASGNVSSITDNGTGLFTANFTTAMPDGNYTSNITTRYTGSGDTLVSCIQGSSFSTTSIAVRIMDSGFALKDPTEVSISVFR